MNSPLPSHATEGKPVVVLGANGKTGRLTVQKLSELGVQVRPTFRGEAVPGGFDGLPGVLPGVRADVTKLDSLDAAVSDASVVIFAASASSKGGSAKEVDFKGVENVANECIRYKIPRLVVISSGAITRPDSLGYKFTNIFGSIMDYKLKGEQALRAAYSNSGDDSLSYIIIRPGGLQEGKGVGPKGVELNQGDTISGEVTREDVADCTAHAAISTSIPKRVTFEIYSAGKGSPLESRFPAKSGFERLGNSYDEMFKELQIGEINI